MIIQVLQLGIDAPPDQVRDASRARMPAYAALDGLLQKYYCRDQVTGAYVGVYVFADRDAYEQYRASDLADALPVVERRVLDVMFPLHDPPSERMEAP